NARPAIPLLAGLARQGTNDSAVIALEQLGMEPQALVLVLIDALPNSQRESRECISKALQNLGTNAVPAVPALLEVYAEEKKRERENELYRRYHLGAAKDIIKALNKIDPDAAAKATAN